MSCGLLASAWKDRGQSPYLIVAAGSGMES